MTAVADLAEAFKREVAVPGAFAEAFPTVQDAGIVGQLMDAFGEAQLDGFFHTMELDVDAQEISPDLSTAGAALVVLYAGIRMLRLRIMTSNAEERYKAGPVEFDVKANTLAQTELLKQLERRQQRVVENSSMSSGSAVFFIDGYAARGLNDFYGGFLPYEVAVDTWRM